MEKDILKTAYDKIVKASTKGKGCRLSFEECSAVALSSHVGDAVDLETGKNVEDDLKEKSYSENVF